MKQILITIAAVVLVGCGPSVDIHKAAKDGNIKAVKQHLEAGVNVNVKADNGWTPLHSAAFNAEKEIVELLIAAGADVNAKDNRGETPLDESNTKLGAKEFGLQDHLSKHVKFGKDGEIANLLIKHGGKTGEYLSIHGAADRGDIETVKQHLAAGTDVNAKKRYGWTPLYYAASGGDKEITELLIAKGADVDAGDRDNITPLRGAIYDGHIEIIELLISSGADVNAKTKRGSTYLHYAANMGQKEIAQLLIAKGVDVNAKDNNRGETPLDRTRNHRLPKMSSAQSASRLKELAKFLRKHGGKTGAELKGGEPVGALATDLTSLSPGRNEVQIKHDGQSRRLIITTPKTFGHQGPYPVLFCFHGAGGKAEGQSKRWSPHADERGLIVISAEAVQPQAKWNFRDKFHAEEHDDVGFVLKVVEALITNKTVDPKAVYATGHSSGGLFCYRLAKETVLFAALSPMSCGMVKGAHDPGEKTKPVSIMQVIGDQDKSFNGSSNPKVTMYSAAKRIDVWRTFNRCRSDPVVVNKGEEVVVYTYDNQSGIEVAFCKVKGQGHHIRRDLRDIGDSAALDFLLKHKRERNRDD
jgi:ankyrin repeat protein/poly(3-hydroxybutyrate) depolymerase